MKKLNQTIFLVFVIITTLKVYSQGLKITGITTPANVNGTYSVQGVDSDGYKYWMDVDGNYVYCDWYGGVEYWNIDTNYNDDDDILYFVEYRDPEAPPSEPPASGWVLWGEATGTPLVTVLWPEISVSGNGQNIKNNDPLPSLTDNTDFGDADITSQTVVHSFTISNSGVWPLGLTGAPLVEIGGTHAGDFSVTLDPNSEIGIGSSSTFQVTFDPTVQGTRSATITISNDDQDESSFSFSIQGTGLDGSLPVALQSLTAVSTSMGIDIEWITSSERDNLGFIIDRKTDDTHWLQIASYKTHTELTGQGTTSSPSQYIYTDKNASAGMNYIYRLTEASITGTINIIGTTSVNETVPVSTQLFTAYPNPFNPTTTLKYNLAKDNHITMTVYDVLGRQIKQLINQKQPAGEYSVQWNGSTDSGQLTPSGTYLIQMNTGNTTHSQKVLFIK